MNFMQLLLYHHIFWIDDSCFRRVLKWGDRCVINTVEVYFAVGNYDEKSSEGRVSARIVPCLYVVRYYT